MSKIPESQLARASIAGSTAFKLGIGELKRKAKRPFLSVEKQEEEKSDQQEQAAKLIFTALSQLRGTAVKMAQMLSMETDLLPVSIQNELKKSHYQVPPLNRVLVRKVVQENFDTPPEKLFSHFNTEAFAAASLGQVHKASLDNGTEVVVKIQYPGICVAMQSDIKLLKKLALGMPNTKVVLQSIDEIYERLLEELDYFNEANNTQWFRNNLQVKGVNVPEVYEQKSAAHVLTTEFMQGDHLDQWLAKNPSQEDRNKAAQRIYDSFTRSVKTLKQLQADPNPGNYLFQENGEVALIDFGCVKQFSDEFIEHLPKLMQAYCDSNLDDILDKYAALGMRFINDKDELYADILKPFGAWLSEPLRHDSFDFKLNSDYSSRGKELIHGLSKVSLEDGIAEDFIFFDRTVYGLCKIFEQLGATVRLRHHWFDNND